MKRFRLLSILTVAALAACAPVPGENAESAIVEDDPVAAEVLREDPIRPLFGQWQVVSVDGEVPGNHDMFLLIGDDWWQMQSQCIWDHGDWTFAGERLDFTRIERVYPDLPPGYRDTIAMCARGLSREEDLLPKVLSETRDYRVDRDRLTISSPLGDVVAERLNKAVVNPMEFTSVDPATTWGEWTIASFEGTALDDAVVVFGAKYFTVRLGCAYYQWFRPASFEAPQPPVRREPFAIGCDHEPDAVEAGALALIAAPERFAAPDASRRTVTGKGKSLLLTR